MKFEEAFNGVKRVFLDTAPVIYYVEQNAYFLSIANRIFEELIEKETGRTCVFALSDKPYNQFPINKKADQ